MKINVLKEKDDFKEEVKKICKSVMLYLKYSADMQTSDLLYKTPAEEPRGQANALEKKDNMIYKFRKFVNKL